MNELPQRRVRAVAVQPQWGTADFLSAARFRAWMRAQLEVARPHLRPDQPNLVVLTELNGLPLLLRGAPLAAASGTFRRAVALLLLARWARVLPLLLRERVASVRALLLEGADRNARLYLRTCRDLAREYRVYLVCGSLPMPHYRLRGGLLRREGTAIFNQTVILGPDGGLVGTADKVHLTPFEEAAGLDLTPGALEELRVFPTPAGELGVAISLDAFRADVVGRLEEQGCTVLLQPDANGSPWTGLEELPPEGATASWTPRDQPLAWLESSWQVTASTGIRYAVNPMVVGNLLDLSFDGQSAICGPVAEAPQPRGYVFTEPRPGFLALLPWVQERGGPGRLREVGRELAAGSGHPRENAYRTGVISADLHLPPLTRPLPPRTPHEEALAGYLSGQARFPRSGRAWWLALLAAGAALWWRRRQRGRPGPC